MDKEIAKILIDKIDRETVDKFIEDNEGNLTGVATISLEALAEEIAVTLKKQGYGDTKQAVREFGEKLKKLCDEKCKLLEELYDKATPKQMKLACNFLDRRFEWGTMKSAINKLLAEGTGE